MLKISSTIYNIIVSISTILITTATLSFVLTFLNNEQKEFPFSIWLKTWKLVFILAYLISLFLPKLVQKIISLVFIAKNN